MAQSNERFNVFHYSIGIMNEPIGEDLSENKQFASFEHGQVFFDTLDAFLSVDLGADPSSEDQSQLEDAQFNKLSRIVGCVILAQGRPF